MTSLLERACKLPSKLLKTPLNPFTSIPLKYINIGRVRRGKAPKARSSSKRKPKPKSK